MDLTGSSIATRFITRSWLIAPSWCVGDPGVGLDVVAREPRDPSGPPTEQIEPRLSASVATPTIVTTSACPGGQVGGRRRSVRWVYVGVPVGIAAGPEHQRDPDLRHPGRTSQPH